MVVIGLRRIRQRQRFASATGTMASAGLQKKNGGSRSGQSPFRGRGRHSYVRRSKRGVGELFITANNRYGNGRLWFESY